MSSHWRPTQVIDDYQPTLDALRWPTSGRRLIEHFLEATQPFRHPLVLLRVASIYRDHFSKPPPDALKSQTALLSDFIEHVGEIQGFFPTRHYRMSHPFAAGLIDLQKRIPSTNLHRYLTTFKQLAGWYGPDHLIESAEHYYEHVLDIKGALLHVHERHNGDALHPDDILERVAELASEAAQYEELPERYTRVPNLSKKLAATLRLLNGDQSLGSRFRSAVELGIDDKALNEEMSLLASPPPISEGVQQVFKQQLERVVELSDQVRAVRRTRHLDADSMVGPDTANKIAEGLANFNAADPVLQKSAIRIVIDGQMPALFAPIKAQLESVRGASESVIRRQLTGMQSAQAKRNNPSPTQFNTHPRAQILRWLVALYEKDPELSKVLLFVWMTGLHPRRLLASTSIAKDQIVELRSDTVCYRVLNHHAVTSDRKLPQIVLQLPRPLINALETLRDSKNSADVLSDLAERYRALHKAFRKRGERLPRFIATWRLSQPGFGDRHLSRFERHLIAGELPFEDWAHSAYISSDLDTLNGAFRSALADVVSALHQIRSVDHDPRKSIGIDELSALVAIEPRAVHANAPPFGLIGSTAPDDKATIQSFLRALYRQATRYRRDFKNAETAKGKATAGLALINAACINYFLLLLSLTGARPHSARMDIEPWMHGLRIEDKDSAAHREFRVITIGSADAWANGKTPLQKQWRILGDSTSVLRSVSTAAGMTIEPLKPAQQWQPIYLDAVTDSQHRWMPLTQSAFWRLSEQLGLGQAHSFRLNHFRHLLASMPITGMDVERRAQLGHIGPGLERFEEQSAEARPLQNLLETEDQNLWNDYGFQVIKALKAP